jgi:hypothetical protein
MNTRSLTETKSRINGEGPIAASPNSGLDKGEVADQLKPDDGINAQTSERVCSKMDLHVDTERLRKVAFNNDILFTRLEFEHLRVCAECLRAWAELFKEAWPEPDSLSPATAP